MSQRVFAAYAVDAELSAEEASLVNEVVLCEHFQGWTLDYVRGMDFLDRRVVLEILEGKSKGLKTRAASGE